MSEIHYADLFERYYFGGSEALRIIPAGGMRVSKLSPEAEGRRVDWLEGEPRLVLALRASWRRCTVSLASAMLPCEERVRELPVAARDLVDTRAHETLRNLVQSVYGSGAMVYALPDIHFYCTRGALRTHSGEGLTRITRDNVEEALAAVVPEMLVNSDDPVGYVLNNGPAFAWYDGGAPVGFASVHPSFMSDKVGNIGNVGVVKTHRRQGIAKALVSAVAGALLADGRMPTYGCLINNVASAATARAVGFKLAAVNFRFYAKDAC